MLLATRGSRKPIRRFKSSHVFRPMYACINAEDTVASLFWYSDRKVLPASLRIYHSSGPGGARMLSVSLASRLLIANSFLYTAQSLCGNGCDITYSENHRCNTNGWPRKDSASLSSSWPSCSLLSFIQFTTTLFFRVHHATKRGF